jgi:hypothetical protein
LSEHNLMHRDVIAQFQLIQKWKLASLNCSAGSDPCPWIRCHGIYSKTDNFDARESAMGGDFGGLNGNEVYAFHLMSGLNLIFPGSVNREWEVGKHARGRLTC